MTRMNALRNYFRWMFMPGLDLFTRRRVRLTKHWLKGDRKVLDAGSGNGWFSYLAYRSGAKVTAVNNEPCQVDKAVNLFNEWRGIASNKLEFLKIDLIDSNFKPEEFDEIICFEVLEHITDDIGVCKKLLGFLKPGGYLHISCPHAGHPRWAHEILSPGLHVRNGYTLESLRSLLEQIGFHIIASEDIGATSLVIVSNFLEKLRMSIGDVLCLPLVVLALPFISLDPKKIKNPYCLYVKAVKPQSSH